MAPYQSDSINLSLRSIKGLLIPLIYPLDLIAPRLADLHTRAANYNANAIPALRPESLVSRKFSGHKSNGGLICVFSSASIGP